MLTIRLQRVGKKNQASFRIVLAEKHRAVKKQVTEILGYYNPRTKDFGVKDPERVKYWIQKHIEISPTAHNLLIDKGLLTGEKVKAWKPKKKPQTKTDSTQTAMDKQSAGEEVKEEQLKAAASAEEKKEQAKLTAETPKVETSASEEKQETKSGDG